MKYYCHITTSAYGEKENVVMEQDCFLYQLTEKIVPGHEIKAVKFFNYEEYILGSVQVAGVLKVFDKLKQDYLIDY